MRWRSLVPLPAAFLLAACSGGGEGPGYTVTVQPGSSALCVGDSLAFTAQVTNGSGQVVSPASLAWASSAPQVVTIDAARGVAHALATGSTQITASSGGARSAPATLDVPADLVPQLVPDSVVLAPGDTMTLGVRLRRASSGPVPGHTPVITPSSTRVASIDASGLVTAKDTGRASFAVGACGQTGGGAADVFTPPDSATGLAYLWLSGAKELRLRLPARAFNLTLSNGGPSFQVAGQISRSRGFVYEDTVRLAATGAFPLDSLLRAEATDSLLQCRPPRPFAAYLDVTSLLQSTQLYGLAGDSLHVTGFTPRAGYVAVSGWMRFRMRGLINTQFTSGAAPDTLAAIYTFSAPLKDTLAACP